MINGEAGSGATRAAGGNGTGLGDASGSLSTAFRRAIILECLRGNWKLRWAVSSECKGIRLEKRRGKFVCAGEDAVDEVGDLAGMSTTEALTCSSFLKEYSVGVKTGGAALAGDGESLTGESGRFTLSAVGGAFRVPLSIDLLGVVVMIAGIGGAEMTGGLEYLLLEEVGTLKLGVAGGE
jgi:hypothetical protein